MAKAKSSTALNSLLDRITSEALRESIDIYLKESESDERVRMAKSLNRRYVNEEDEEEGKKEMSDGAEGIPKEKIAPGGDTEKSGEPDGGGEAEAEAPEVPVPTDEELMSPSFETIRDQLNLLRSGSSLKNPDIDKQFRSYIESLSEESSRQLLVFITGLAQLIAGNMPASEVMKPSDKSPAPGKDKSQGAASDSDAVELSVSDDNGSMPIVVGEHAAVRNLIERAKKRS